MALVAHNDVYGELFRYLDQMQIGDTITVQTATHDYTYTVRGWDTNPDQAYGIVEPTDVQVLEDRGRPTLTLLSCYPYGVDNRRIVVYADRDN